MSKLRGTVRNGVIVLEPPASLPEGATVLIEVTEAPATREIPAKEWLDQFFGVWKDDPGIDAWLRERAEERRRWDDEHP